MEKLLELVVVTDEKIFNDLGSRDKILAKYQKLSTKMPGCPARICGIGKDGRGYVATNNVPFDWDSIQLVADVDFNGRRPYTYLAHKYGSSVETIETLYGVKECPVKWHYQFWDILRQQQEEGDFFYRWIENCRVEKTAPVKSHTQAPKEESANEVISYYELSYMNLND